MNEKNIKALLKGLGIPDSIITEAERDDFDPSKVIADYNSSQKAHYHDIIKNEIAGEIEDEAFRKAEGKLLGTLNHDLKKIFGVPLDNIKDLHPNEKLKVAKAHIEEAYSKNPNAEEIKKLQEELIETRNAYTDLEGKLPKEIERIQKEGKQKMVHKLADIDLQKKFNSIPADKLLGKVHAPGYFVAMKADILEKYDFDLDEKENPILFEKGTSKRATGKNAEGKEYFLNLDEDLLLTSLDRQGFLSKSNGGEGSGNAGKGGSSNGQQPQKSQRMLELEAKAKAAA